MFLIKHVKKLMMPDIKKLLGSGRPDIMWWDYLRWLGMWILLLTIDRHPIGDFWKVPKKKEDDRVIKYKFPNDVNMTQNSI